MFYNKTIDHEKDLPTRSEMRETQTAKAKAMGKQMMARAADRAMETEKENMEGIGSLLKKARQDRLVQRHNFPT